MRLSIARNGSPPGGSTLMTSAPKSPSRDVPYGPARTCVKSTTRTPSSTPRAPPGLDASDDTVALQDRELFRLDVEPLAQDQLRVLAQPRAGVADAARRTRQLWRHILHPDLPEVWVGHGRQVPASFEMRVFESIANV